MTTARGDRSIIASLGAHEKWLRCDDRSAATAAARRAFEDRFVDEADPGGKIRAMIVKVGCDTRQGHELLRELEKRTGHAKSAYYKRLALSSVRSRRAQRSTTTEQ